MAQYKDRIRFGTQAGALLIAELYLSENSNDSCLTGLLWGLNEMLWVQVDVNDKFRKEQNHSRE